MIQIRNRFIPTKGYAALFFFGILFVRKNSIISKTTIRHEKIHEKQCIEMLGIFFYLFYILEWLFKLAKYKDTKKAYYNISFEREAYKNQSDLNYLNTRKWYSWVKYI